MSILWTAFAFYNKFDDVVVMVGLAFFAAVDLMLIFMSVLANG